MKTMRDILEAYNSLNDLSYSHFFSLLKRNNLFLKITENITLFFILRNDKFLTSSGLRIGDVIWMFIEA